MCKALCPEHVQAAIDECVKAGVDYDYEIVRSNKFRFEIHMNGKCKIIYMSKTPSDFRVPLKVASQVKRFIKEMRL